MTPQPSYADAPVTTSYYRPTTGNNQSTSSSQLPVPRHDDDYVNDDPNHRDPILTQLDRCDRCCCPGPCLRYVNRRPDMTVEEWDAADRHNARVFNLRKLLILPVMLVVFLILRYGFGLRRQDD